MTVHNASQQTLGTPCQGAEFAL